MNTPMIRFNGYDEDWEKVKLGDVGSTKSGVGFPTVEQGGLEGVPFYKVSDMNNSGNEREMQLSNNYVTQEQIDDMNWKVIKDVPSIVFAKVGAAIMLNRKRLVREPYLIDNNMMAYIFNDIWNIEFAKTLFDTVNLPRYAQVGALPSYNGSDIETISVNIPLLEEQEQIGNFFKTLDEIITAEEDKMSLLEEYKEAMLQKMFPKKEKNVPEIRFEGYDEEWEEVKLGDVVSDIYQPKMLSKSNMVNGEYGVFGANGYIGKHNEYNHDSPQIGISCRGANSGHVNYIDAYSWITGNSMVINIDKSEDVDKIFLYHLLSNQPLKYMVTGSAHPQIVKSDVEIHKAKLPTIEEQEQIGNFFKSLDDKIELQQKYIDDLQEVKESFLQKMFV